MIATLFNKIAPALVRTEAKRQAKAATEEQRRLLEICSLSPEAALTALQTSDRGLTGEEVERRRGQYGRNVLALKKGGAFRDLLERFRNPLVIQLLVICGLSLWLGDVHAATVVGGMLLLSVGISYVQETRSSRAVEKLRALVQTTTLVRRD